MEYTTEAKDILTIRNFTVDKHTNTKIKKFLNENNFNQALRLQVKVGIEYFNPSFTNWDSLTISDITNISGILSNG